MDCRDDSNQNFSQKRSTRIHLCLLAVGIVGWIQVDHRACADESTEHETSEQAAIPPRSLDSEFPFTPSESVEAWNARAATLRRQIRVATGLWPTPTATPARAVVHGRVDRDDYTVEKVYFESAPGFYVTGNLYRPKGEGAERPGVLCPHGHWSGGRFMDTGPEEIRKQLVQGAERFEFAGRFPIQARCVQLARMGCVVFQYDMVGYADSVQIPQRVAHGAKRDDEEDDNGDAHRYFSTWAEARCLNIMGLQTYNSLRALDWLASLPDVDPNRIAVTGASGGGTQTFILCAIDPRPAVAFPAVMASTAMQGGCTCENASCLRVDAGNIDFVALFAPKPLGLTAADDWTRAMATKGFPELKRHYAMHGAEDHVALTPLTHFGHNYNYVSRAAMYAWMNKHLGLGWEEPIVEEDFEPLTQQEMTVWDHAHPTPEGGAALERRLLDWLAKDAEQQIAALAPTTSKSMAPFREIVGGAFEVLLGQDTPIRDVVATRRENDAAVGELQAIQFEVRESDADEPTNAFVLPPIDAEPNGQFVFWIHPDGMAGLCDDSGAVRAEIRELLSNGFVVIVAGIANSPDELQPVNDERFAGYTFGYNRSNFAQRVHDVMVQITALRESGEEVKGIHLIGENGAGPLAAAVRALAGDLVDSSAIDTDGFRFASLDDWRDEDFMPGAVKYGDLPALLALGAPNKLWLAGEKDGVPPVVAAAYLALESPERVTLFEGEQKDATAAAVQWLIESANSTAP